VHVHKVDLGTKLLPPPHAGATPALGREEGCALRLPPQEQEEQEVVLLVRAGGKHKQEGEEQDKGKSVRQEEEEEEEEETRASFRLCQLLWHTCVCLVGLVQGWGGRVGRGVGAL